MRVSQIPPTLFAHTRARSDYYDQKGLLPKLVTVVHTSRYTRPAKGRLLRPEGRIPSDCYPDCLLIPIPDIHTVRPTDTYFSQSQKTNDSSVADLLNPPGTHYALDHVRPDFVLTRVCAKALIMWDSVEPSIDWMEGQLPPLLRPPLTKIAGSAFYEPRTGRCAGGPFPTPGTHCLPIGRTYTVCPYIAQHVTDG